MIDLWGYLSVVYFTVNKGDHRQDVERVLFIHIPLYLRRMCQWITDSSIKPNEETDETSLFALQCICVEGIDNKSGSARSRSKSRMDKIGAV